MKVKEMEGTDVLDDILAAMGYDEDIDAGGREYYIDEASKLTPEEAFDAYLRWNGIQGYTNLIISAMSNINQAREDNQEPIGQ